MTLSALRGRGHRRVTSPPAALPIGEDATNVVGCPVCARPILAGSSRCIGCGTRFLLGVPARRAVVFVVVGISLGMWIGALVAMAVARPTAVPAAGAATPASSAAAAAASSKPHPTPPAASVDPAADVPPDAVAALEQLPPTNARLLADGAALRAVATAPKADGADIADALRSVAVDAAFGSDLSTRLVGWPAASETRVALIAFYADVRDACRAALSTSVQDTSGYRTAASKVVASLDGVGRADASARTLAASVGIELPAVAPASATP